MRKTPVLLLMACVLLVSFLLNGCAADDKSGDISSALAESLLESAQQQNGQHGSSAPIEENLQPQESEAPPPSGAPDISKLLDNAQMMAKLSSIMNAMNKKDDRTKLIEALKPLLSEKRRKKADEAMQILKLLDILPTLSNLMGGDGKW